MTQPSSATARADVFVTVLGVVDMHTRDIAQFVLDVDGAVSTRYSNYEIVLIDNGVSHNDLATLRSLLDTVPCVRLLRLGRPQPLDTAIFAGLEAAIGDYVVVISPGKDPVSAIEPVVERLVGGADAVQGLSADRLDSSIIGRAGRSLFYWYNGRFLDVEIPPNATYLTGLTRRGVNALTRSTRTHRYLRHMLRHVGFELSEFEYSPVEPSVKARTFRSGAIEAAEMISSYSTHPLRIVTATGLIAALANLLYAVYVVIINITRAEVAPGWTTTSLQLSVMFFLICLILAVQAEYLGRILTESRREASYTVTEELESTVLLTDAQRRNVSS